MGLKPLTEAEFTRQVLAIAKLRGWRSAHFRPGMNRRGKWETAVQGDGVGWPDLLLLRGDRMLAVELKVGRNKATREQLDWLLAFEDAGVRNYLWYPTDWQEIERVLE